MERVVAIGASFFHETRVTIGAHEQERDTTVDESASGDQLTPQAPCDSVADLARGMDSDLTAESTPGADSTFTLTLRGSVSVKVPAFAQQRLADLPTKR